MPLDEITAIRQSQHRSSMLEPSPEQVIVWQEAANLIIQKFLQKLPDHPTYQKTSPELFESFAIALAKADDVPAHLALIERHMGEAGLLTAGPGHLAFVPGGGLYIGAVADHLAAAINSFSADAFASPIAVKIHQEVIRNLANMVGYPIEAWGDITSGGSQATLTAFWIARDSRGIRPRDYDKTVVYAAEHTHHCCEKALRILFGADLIFRNVPLLDHGIDPRALNELIRQDREAGLKPFMIVATAGSTNLGRIDPITDIAEIAEAEHLWLHIDAAYGGFFMLCDELRSKFAGLEKADSIVLDPHKGLFLPYGCGAVLFRNGELLRQDKAHAGDYLQDRTDSDLRSPMDYSMELTRPFRSLRIWLAWQCHGREALAEALREKHLLAVYCRKEFQKIPSIECIGGLDLSIFAFSLKSADKVTTDLMNRALLQAINQHPEVFLSSTLIDGSFVLRVAILSFRTHIETVDRLIAIIREESQKLLGATV